MINLELLPETFEGKGEVKDSTFKQVYSDIIGYVYEVTQDGHKHFECFLKKQSFICTDFKNRIYSETHKKELYPKSNSFGVWAWTTTRYERALEKLKEVNLFQQSTFNN